MNITVLTSITGGKDILVEGQAKGDSRFVAYTDTEQFSQDWEIKPAYNRFNSARRNSRVPKILSHQFCDTEYSLWIDGNIQLNEIPQNLVARYLRNHDIAVFKHPVRKCIYAEAMQCAKLRLDDPEVIIAQVKGYEDAGYAKNKGLCECGFILRRHTDEVIKLNNYWWSEYSRHSVRDQISFMYSVDTVGIRVNVIDIPWSGTQMEAHKEGILTIYPHLTAQPEP